MAHELWLWFKTGVPPSYQVSAEEYRDFSVSNQRSLRRELYLIIGLWTSINVIWWFSDPWIYAELPRAREIFPMVRTALLLIGVTTLVVHSLFPRSAQLTGVFAGALVVFCASRGMGLIGGPSTPWFHFLYPFLLILVITWQTPLERVLTTVLFAETMLIGYFGANPDWWTEPYTSLAVSYFIYMVLLSYLIGLFLDRSRFQLHFAMREVEQAKRLLEARVAEKTQELRTFVSHLDTVQDQERSRIARDLHDEVGQTLAAQRLIMETTLKRYAADSQAVGPNLIQLKVLGDQLTTEFREILHGLRPRVLDELGLKTALKALAQQCEERLLLPCALTLPTQELQLPEAHATAIYRAIQEALTNAAKHAKAKEVTVHITLGEGMIIGEVRDNGRGIPRNKNTQGFGLLGARERLAALGGRLQVAPATGGGTLFRMELPLTEASPT